jgi:hypothetical protein
VDPSGELLICDIGNHRIRQVDFSTGVIETYGPERHEAERDGSEQSPREKGGPNHAPWGGGYGDVGSGPRFQQGML